MGDELGARAVRNQVAVWASKPKKDYSVILPRRKNDFAWQQFHFLRRDEYPAKAFHIPDQKRPESKTLKPRSKM
ncbi:unnamed protein product [Ilex paraguariensis]|uniref:Uncharacterized protein n=1 Tax=Ilex paraguariensis TaxID=185542 RepID=A0ABC8URK7_9AQUA